MTIPRVCNANEYYMNKKKLHAKNERLYVATKKDTILKQVCHIAIWKRKWKVVQFYVCFHMFKGTPRWLIMKAWTIYCISLIMSRTFQKPNDQSDWEMASCMHQLVVMNKTKSLVGGVRFISLSWWQLLISNLGFPFVPTLLKIGNKLHCCYPCNEC